ncbi:hypothetical protein [Mesorhizobium sp. M8A.F.Ca.ET.165.01.1.1]|uniref:hypothetical protein n=1 Tax=Mesorhizobium sp. M8A.F.Ca.ET.165.01.1.1 TaxID=2563960 RepID=UPI00109414B7|nr:hypothetical protein [Mesorhizobium sp. M8A.F.Ca.ET.165.01.1.1]TGT42763.1 hypothetical protein EN808_12840 [Mesorhizobium sp. M8A.F.Ca.ET.165.01.1.1]
MPRTKPSDDFKTLFIKMQHNPGIKQCLLAIRRLEGSTSNVQIVAVALKERLERLQQERAAR